MSGRASGVKMVGMVQVGVPISLDEWQSIRILGASACVLILLIFAPENPEDGKMYLLVLAHPGSPGQSPESHKMVVVVVHVVYFVMVPVCLLVHVRFVAIGLV